MVSADHQNKPDIGSAIARRWLDVGGVDAIVDLPNSGVALAVNEIVRGTKSCSSGFKYRLLGFDRQSVLAEYRPMDLRYLVHRQRDR